MLSLLMPQKAYRNGKGLIYFLNMRAWSIAL
jgi:hypothetical protein